MPRYTFTRCAIVCETHAVDARDEADAREQMHTYPSKPIASDFVDWYSDDFILESEEIPNPKQTTNPADTEEE